MRKYFMAGLFCLSLANTLWAQNTHQRVIIEKDGKTNVFIAWSVEDDIRVDRQEFLKGLHPGDMIKIRWKGFQANTLRPLGNEFNLEMYPVLTWNNWVDSFFKPKIKLNVPPGYSTSNQNLGEIIIPAVELVSRVERAGGATGRGLVRPEVAGFKIAVDLDDSRSFLILAQVKKFQPAYFDPQDLLKMPNYTKNFVLTLGDARAMVEVQLVRTNPI